LRHPARWIAIAVGVVALLFAGALAASVDNDPALESGKLLGKRAPSFAGRDLDGEAVRSSDFAGKALFVNFWNDWCLPCREETPALREFWEAHRDDPDFAMVGIVRDTRGEQALRDYAFEHGVEWPVVFDPEGRAAVDFATTGQPESFMIDANGDVVGFQAGASDLEDLETMLAAARGSPGDGP
jgi:thiol-disulfide isomerase/thioredoxin